MALIEIVQQAQDGRAMHNLARQFGIAPEQAQAVVAGVMPEVARRLESATLSRGGLADLLAMLGTARPDNVLDSASALADPATKQLGIAFLEQILGTKDQSRAVAGRAAQTSGVPESIIKSMLPYVITMVMGALAKQSSGSLGDLLTRLPAKVRGGRNAAGAPVSGASPLSLPDGPPSSWGGGASPYGELSDALRRRGTRVDGSPLGRIVRDVVGGVLGFRSRGIVSWIIRFFVIRWGWTIARAVLGRMFRMR